MEVELLPFPWQESFKGFLAQTGEELVISSPFISGQGVNLLCSCLKRPNAIEVRVITNLSVENIVRRATEPEALLTLFDRFGEVEISSLGRLHAKVYIIDKRTSIITSANLTEGGMFHNYEYGVVIDDHRLSSRIRDDILSYFRLGNRLSQELLRLLQSRVESIRKSVEEKEKLPEVSTINKEVEKATEEIETLLLRNRIAEGRTINSIFSETILYLLRRYGPLTTRQIHPYVQKIHPDICDDSIDRVIDGQHFGKLWKHQVRNAIEFLKRRGRIERLKNGKHRLIGKK